MKKIYKDNLIFNKNMKVHFLDFNEVSKNYLDKNEVFLNINDRNSPIIGEKKENVIEIKTVEDLVNYKNSFCHNLFENIVFYSDEGGKILYIVYKKNDSKTLEESHNINSILMEIEIIRFK